MEVKIYTTTTCPACNMAKEFLNYNNIKYKSITVGVDITPEEFMEQTQASSVPIIFVNDEKIIGFDHERLTELLKI